LRPRSRRRSICSTRQKCWTSLEEVGDLEPDADEEPSLGSSNDYHGSKSRGQWGEGTPANGWDAGREGPEEDLEPSLGVREIHASIYSERSGDQTSWAFSGNDQDLEDEHDGAEPDEDGEPELGATTSIDQVQAWRRRAVAFGGVADGGESSLGWPNMPPGRGHRETAMRGYADDREQDIADQPHDDFGEAEPDSYRDAWDALGREQAAMRVVAVRFQNIVARVRSAGDPVRPPAGVVYVDTHEAEGVYDVTRFDRLSGPAS
jgi:hypothetical protein